MTYPTYELITFDDGKQTVLRKDEDGKIYSIPTDPANSDYQAYLKYLEENK
jgi:hypothetical protein